jgi:hypothetical protein
MDCEFLSFYKLVRKKHVRLDVSDFYYFIHVPQECASILLVRLGASGSYECFATGNPLQKPRSEYVFLGGDLHNDILVKKYDSCR